LFIERGHLPAEYALDLLTPVVQWSSRALHRDLVTPNVEVQPTSQRSWRRSAAMTG
jgi:hypothetical protein